MLSQRTVETLVGLFLLAATLCLMVLAFKVSGLTSFFQQQGYDVSAYFDDVGQLKVRAPIKMGGVVVGEVTGIKLDSSTFRAQVSMRIFSNFNDIPDDSTASILTAGLLGDNYVELSPMYSQTFLKQGSQIQDTHSAMILEKLVGQLVYKLGGGSKESASNTQEKTTPSGAQK